MPPSEVSAPPTNAQAKARKLSEAQDWPAAAQAWQALAASSPGYEAFFRLAQAQFFLERPEAVIEAGRRAAAFAPADPRPLVLVARSLTRLARFQEAAASWADVVRLEPKSYEGLARLAESEIHLGRLDEAAAPLARAIAENPQARFAYIVGGRLLPALPPAAADALLAEILAAGPERDSPPVYPDSLLEQLCGEAIARPVQAEWTGGPIVLFDGARCADGRDGQIHTVLQALALRLGPDPLRVVVSRTTGDPERETLGFAAADAEAAFTLLSAAPEGVEAPELSALETGYVDLLGEAGAIAVRRLAAELRRQRAGAVQLWADRGALEGALAAVLVGVPRIVITFADPRVELSDAAARAFRGLVARDGVVVCAPDTRRARALERRIGLAPKSVQALDGASPERLLEILGWSDTAAVWPEPAAVYPLKISARRMLREGDPQEAAELWRQATALSPDDPDAWLYLGVASFRLGKADEAMEHLLKAQAKGAPEEVLRWLGRAAGVLGEHRDALGYWTALLEAKSADFEALFRIAESHVDLGDARAAIAALGQASASHPGDPRLLRLWARLLLPVGDLEGSLGRWLELLQSEPDDDEALFRAGETALRLGDGPRGEELLRRALQRPEPHSRAVAALARHFAWSGRLEQGRALCRRFRRARPNDLDIARTGFELERIAGRDSAIDRYFARLFRTAVEPDDQLRIADLLLAADRPLSALRLLAAVPPGSPVGEAAAERIIATALRAGDIATAEAAARRLGAPARLKAQLAAAARFRSSLGVRADGDLVQAFLDHLATTASNGLRYRPRPGALLHVVNSVAAGGTERQCANLIGAAVAADPNAHTSLALLRTDPARQGRATFFLEPVVSAGVASETLASFGLDGRVDAELLGFEPPEGLLAEALLPRQVGPLVAAIRAFRPEAIMVWSPQCMADVAVAAALLGAPRVILRSGSVALPSRDTTTETESVRYGLWRGALRMILQTPSGVLLNNCRANLLDWLQWLGLDAKSLGPRADVLPNLVDMDRFSPVEAAQVAALRRALQIPEDAKVVGTVIRLEPEKGVDLWLEVVRSVASRRRDVVFVVVGDGRLSSALHQDVERLGLSDMVRLSGRVGDELPLYYSLFDAFLLTSVVEGLPNAVLEALCFGLPIVAPRVGGMAEATPDEPPHRLLDGRRSEVYADALLDILDAGLSKTELLRAGRRFIADRFSPASVLAKLEGVMPRGG